MGYPIERPACVRTEDMAKLGEVYQNGGTFEGKRLLSKEWVELVFEREYELAKMENGGHCKGAYERTDAVSVASWPRDRVAEL